MTRERRKWNFYIILLNFDDKMDNVRVAIKDKEEDKDVMFESYRCVICDLSNL